MSVVEQRHRAVLAVLSGIPVVEVAAGMGVSRHSVHRWLVRYRGEGLAGLVDRSRRPHHSPGQLADTVEVLICELRRGHPRWGPRRIHHELGSRGVAVPARSTVYQVLVRHGLIEAVARRRKRREFRRWERDEPMSLWQVDIVSGVMVANPTGGDPLEAKVVTGVDDHSRFCVMASVVPRATGRAVCAAFAHALRRYGVPEEILSDNGKQFTARFGLGGEVLFDRICRHNGIAHRLTRPASPTTTGKVERFHQTLRRELLNDGEIYPSLAAAQAAMDTWVEEYNHKRPHQSLDMATPASRFGHDPTKAAADAALLALWLPAELQTVVGSANLPATADGNQHAGAGSDPAVDDQTTKITASPTPVLPSGGIVGPIEFERVVPPSGNLLVAGRQFWLGPARAGLRITFWADVDVIHLLNAGNRIKTLRSHLSTADIAHLVAAGARPAGPSPLPAPEPGAVLEVERLVRRNGQVSLGDHQVLAAEILAGRHVGIRIEAATLMFFDPDTRQLLRTRPNPIPLEKARLLRGARPAGPPPRPSLEPITVQRRTSATGAIMIAGQVIAVGRSHSHNILTAHVSETTITIELDDETRTYRRNTTKPVTQTKAHRPRKATNVL